MSSIRDHSSLLAPPVAIAGASAGLLGELLAGQGDVLTRAGGVVLTVLGMQMAGLIHIPYLDRTYQIG